MTINGVSQTSGQQRLVDIAPSGDKLQVGIRDRKPGSDWVNVVVPAESLLTVLTEKPTGPQAIPGDDATLVAEIRRNEVQLAIGTADAAVGLDDLMDAVGSVLPS
ncbi:hypothetical protein [Limnoglobus roseus]|uniref:Uncharacterized protein n=1 Tax=Limnoglobus roseus TaxID=2598579 RepID=A0A5C1AF90_9BACT|nr:hypothetical protein [Limnoglobus roseus]QEL16636.1 hypothetical protein PX52LOC_03596 [Limnoglobus roseus]